VFPLAIPLLSGPGALTSTLLLSDLARGRPGAVAALVVSVAAVFAVSYIILRYGTGLLLRAGQRSMNILTRVLGLVTAALAVQYVLNGITGYYQLVRAIH
jgi:multiple antibiotic resistance protein